MSKNYNNEMTEFTKEYIRSVRMCSYLIEPPASEVIEHLCDEIERLTAENAELREANRWISVDERLPEKSDWYYVISYSERDKTQYTTFGLFNYFHRTWNTKHNEVLYWRENLPLPTLPEKEE